MAETVPGPQRTLEDPGCGRRRAAVWLALGALSCAPDRAPPPRASAPSSVALAASSESLIDGSATGLDVLDYDLALAVDHASASITGEVVITLRTPAPTVTLSAVDMQLQRVQVDGASASFTYDGAALEVQLPRGPVEREVAITYTARPTKGLYLGDDLVYTSFHTARWLPSHDRPGDTATFQLRLTARPGLTVAATGVSKGRERTPDGRETHRFSSHLPMPAFTLGFVAGALEERTRDVDGLPVRLLAAPPQVARLEPLLAETEEMVRFFREVGGSYLFSSYTQVFVPGATPQELASLAILPADYGEAALADPHEDWLLAHELAHQWWAIRVPCAEWGDFWLNEAFAVFMVAAYKERRWGRDEYDRELALARRRYEALRERGEDRPLALSGARTSDEVAGPLSYTKGALVLHALRGELGDEAFWRGVSAYSLSSSLAGVTTGDLQAAMEWAGDRDLSAFFERWVYAVDAPALTVSQRVEGGVLTVIVTQPAAQPWRGTLPVRVTTEAGTTAHDLAVSGSRHALQVALDGPLRSVRVNADGRVPWRITHDRPVEMLIEQLAREPDALGRADAAGELQAACERDASICARARRALQRSATDDPARVVRSRASQALDAAKR
ncbi:MAG: M1 family metallopeptidase [Nannocystaceae bacterium]